MEEEGEVSEESSTDESDSRYRMRLFSALKPEEEILRRGQTGHMSEVWKEAKKYTQTGKKINQANQQTDREKIDRRKKVCKTIEIFNICRKEKTMVLI